MWREETKRIQGFYVKSFSLDFQLSNCYMCYICYEMLEATDFWWLNFHGIKGITVFV